MGCYFLIPEFKEGVNEAFHMLTSEDQDEIQRWVKQFGEVKPSDVKRADRDANGLRQHTVELEKGNFNGGMGGGKPKDNYGLIGGIVETPSGAYFFKMTGPSKTVKNAKPDFYKLLDSIKVSA